MSELKPTIGHLSPNSPRAADWRKVYGSLDVPLLSPVAELAHGPDGKVAQYYRLDVPKAIEQFPGVIDRIVSHVAERFGVPPLEVFQDIEAYGVPILAQDVRVSFDARLVADDEPQAWAPYWDPDPPPEAA